jgi:hypothetical protein
MCNVKTVSHPKYSTVHNLLDARRIGLHHYRFESCPDYKRQNKFIKFKYMITLEDLVFYEDGEKYYYVGNLLDVDGVNWVNEEEAIKLLKIINQ